MGKAGKGFCNSVFFMLLIVSFMLLNSDAAEAYCSSNGNSVYYEWKLLCQV